MRILVFWSFLFLLVSVLPARSQGWRATPYEIHAGIGLTNYFGDIGGSADENTWFGIKDYDPVRTRPGFSAGLRYFRSNNVAFNGVLTFGWLSGSDQGWKNDGRGYVFNTVLLEPTVRIEYFPLKDLQIGNGVNRRGMRRNYSTISAYIFGGAGAAFYNVIPNESLESRQTREAIEHGFISVVLPAGLGFKVGIRNNMDLGFEICGRYVMNDFIDGLTTEMSTSNDIYYTSSIKLIYRLSDLSLGTGN
jgi:hypothetical protein